MLALNRAKIGPNLHSFRTCILTSAALGVLAFGPAPLLAQNSATPRLQDEGASAIGGFTAPENTRQTTENTRTVIFSADDAAYDEDKDLYTATGTVVLRSEGKTLRADKVSWSGSGKNVVADGNVRFVDEDGNQVYTEHLELTNQFETGSMSDLLLALREGGRLAANGGERLPNGHYALHKAAYSGCAIVDDSGCDAKPSWRVTAKTVNYDPSKQKIAFKGAFLELFGARIVPLPGLVVPTDGKAQSGFLSPDIRFSVSNGMEIGGKYYLRLAPDKDIQLGANVFTKAPPLLSAQWRQLTRLGAYQISGYGTYSRHSSDMTGALAGQNAARGYIFANGTFQLDPNWSVTGSLRRVSDRTFLRRYDISREDRLRSTINVERIDETSYLSIAGWATQSLKLTANQGLIPVALPAIDYRKRSENLLNLGDRLEVQANSLALFRSAGQDTQRAFVSAKWDLRRILPQGQIVSFTALGRGDVYHTSDVTKTITQIYQGTNGWQTRAIGLAAIDVQWPLVGAGFGGTQIVTPRIQLVASPPLRNLAVPNEDARAIDLEDSNLFALNRFPGYDRIEDSVRVTYGADWEIQRPSWNIKSNIGQSYRFQKDPGVLIQGTGLSDRRSDFVGRTEVRYRDFLKFTHRFRLDKDNLAVRRNEIDATFGTRRTYGEIGYIRLNRDIPDTIEDLRDREELRVAGRVAFAKFWSVFGSGVFNLTSNKDDPTVNSSGFQAIRTRLGMSYQDDCIELGLTWRRDYVDTGDARRGNSFNFYINIKNIGA